MGWGDCGKDSQGRPIGYLFKATCDDPGCAEKIDRGIAYICGGQMHGADEISCEKYFCEKHTQWQVLVTHGEPETIDYYAHVCDECVQKLLASGEWIEDEMEGLIIRNKEKK